MIKRCITQLVVKTCRSIDLTPSKASIKRGEPPSKRIDSFSDIHYMHHPQTKEPPEKTLWHNKKSFGTVEDPSM